MKLKFRPTHAYKKTKKKVPDNRNEIIENFVESIEIYRSETGNLIHKRKKIYIFTSRNCHTNTF